MTEESLKYSQNEVPLHNILDSSAQWWFGNHLLLKSGFTETDYIIRSYDPLFISPLLYENFIKNPSPSEDDTKLANNLMYYLTDFFASQVTGLLDSPDDFDNLETKAMCLALLNKIKDNCLTDIKNFFRSNTSSIINTFLMNNKKLQFAHKVIKILCSYENLKKAYYKGKLMKYKTENWKFIINKSLDIVLANIPYTVTLDKLYSDTESLEKILNCEEELDLLIDTCINVKSFQGINTLKSAIDTYLLTLTLSKIKQWPIYSTEACILEESLKNHQSNIRSQIYNLKKEYLKAMGNEDNIENITNFLSRIFKFNVLYTVYNQGTILSKPAKNSFFFWKTSLDCPINSHINLRNCTVFG